MIETTDQWIKNIKHNLDTAIWSFNVKNLTALIIFIEFLYISINFIKIPTPLVAFTIFTATFIIPGLLLLIIMNYKSRVNILELFVEGFLVSLFLVSLIPLGFAIIGLSLNGLLVSFVNFLIVTSLLFFVYNKRKNLTISVLNIDIITLTLATLFFIFLFTFLSYFPKFTVPDETLYIYSAHLLLLGKLPMPVMPPYSSFFKIIVLSRILWYSQTAYFLVVFSSISPIKPVIGVVFITMLSLSSILFFDRKKDPLLFFASFFTIITTPILVSFANTYLNDLALTFYIFVAIGYFSNAITKSSNCKFHINLKEQFKSFVIVLFLFLIKPNILFFLPMWFVLLSMLVMVKKNRCNMPSVTIIKLIVSLPLLYELMFDLPFSISYWILGNESLVSFFKRYLLISPITMLVSIFMPPSTNPNLRTLLTLPVIDCVDRFYRLLSFESINIVTSTIILIVVPLIFIVRSKKAKLEIKFYILTTILVTSFWLFFLLSYNMFGDIPRYSLWMVPLWIILTMKLLKIIIKWQSWMFSFLIGLSGFVLYLINLYIFSEKKGVFVGYLPETRVDTSSYLFLCTVILVLILVSSYLAEKSIGVLGRHIIGKTTHLKYITKKKLKPITFISVVLLIIFSNLYSTNILISNNLLYQDHGLSKINDGLKEVMYAGSEPPLIVTNSYVYMRSYVDDYVLKTGKLLPLPDTNESLTTLFNTAPENTLFLISGDSDITRFSYNDHYMRRYVDSDVITPETEKIVRYPNINLPNRVLYMSFDNINESYIPDNSPYNNYGSNNGAVPTKGIFGDAVYFNGSAYISVKNSSLFDITNSLTISFFASVEKAEPHKGYMIVSKGHGSFNGSYSVFVYNSYMYFELGNVGHLHFSVLPYVGTWHHYVFIYNNEKMMAFVDGVLAAVTYAKGSIRKSNYPLEIGRDSERGDYFFIGKLDELQITSFAVNVTTIASAYFDSYAVRIKTIFTPKGNCSIFRLIHEKNTDNNDSASSIVLKEASLTRIVNDSVNIRIQVQSQVMSNNITILAVNEKATKVFSVTLTRGVNNLSFVIPKEPGWSYWYFSTRIRLIIISHGKIISNTIIDLFDLRAVYLVTLLILIGIFVCYLLLINEVVLLKIYSAVSKLIRRQVNLKNNFFAFVCLKLLKKYRLN